MGGRGSGGARLRSGPAPDPNALRRERDGKDWIKLPAEGRTQDPPLWPEEVAKPSVAELAMWNRLWRKPQAIIWEQDGVEDQVALYVRCFIGAARPDASAPQRTVVRQMADALLLTIPALHAARYTISTTPSSTELSEHHPAAKRATVRSMLKVVEPTPDATED